MYKLNKTGIKRLADGAFIPFADGNRDYDEFKAWKAKGNTPEPEDVVDPNVIVQATIDAQEAGSFMNRGAREFFMRSIEREAVDLAAANNVTVAQVLAAQPFYVKLKQLDDGIRVLRAKLK